eukprot:gene2532-biopygen8022
MVHNVSVAVGRLGRCTPTHRVRACARVPCVQAAVRAGGSAGLIVGVREELLDVLSHLLLDLMHIEPPSKDIDEIKGAIEEVDGDGVVHQGSRAQTRGNQTELPPWCSISRTPLTK